MTVGAAVWLLWEMAGGRENFARRVQVPALKALKVAGAAKEKEGEKLLRTCYFKL
ncbi:MAG: hypothetical protein QXJ74_07875 [Nitrososphaera sp.]